MDPALQEDSQLHPVQRGQPSPQAGQHRGSQGPKGGPEAAHLDVLVQNPACGWEGAVHLLLPHDPALGGRQLPGVNEDEASRLGKGLQDKGCEPETGPEGLGGAEQGRLPRASLGELGDAPESP